MQTKPWFNYPGAFLKGGLFLVLVTWLSVAGWAQNQPAADPLGQAKLDIWTETASFVYRDANIPEPASIANAADISQFVEAIKKDDSKSQIFSKLYRPIEETGTYKKGADEKTQLDLLIKSINLKLRENEQRMKDINRRQKLSDLYKQLQQIAADYTTPTPSPTAVTTGGSNPDNADTDALPVLQGNGVSSRTVPDTSDDNYAENQLSSISKKQNTPYTDNYKLMSTAALILGLINLGLFFFLFKGINKLNTRMDQRKKDLDTLTNQLNTGGKGGGSADSGGKLTMSAIESMVQKTIARELAKNGPTGPNRPIQAAAKYEPKPEPAPVREEVTPAPNPVADESVGLSGSSSRIEEAPVVPVTPVAVAPAPEIKPQSFFARVPVNGGFHEQDLYPTQQHDSIYEIRLSKKDPSKAAFRIVTNSNVHRTAIESAYLSLKDACNYQLNNQNATRIVTDEPGLLSLQDGTWQIDKKAQIHFE